MLKGAAGFLGKFGHSCQNFSLFIDRVPIPRYDTRVLLSNFIAVRRIGSGNYEDQT